MNVPSVLLLLIVALASTAHGLECGKTNSPNKLSSKARIAGGFAANAGQFPSYVELDIATDNPNYYIACGGTLIDSQHIVSAAHCFVEGFGTIIVKNFFSQEIGIAAKVCISDRFYLAGFIYDVAVLKLESPVSFDDHLQPACLPNQPFSYYSHAFAVGKGQTSHGYRSNDLMAISVKKMDCPWDVDHPTVVCMVSTNRRGKTCEGDSGGPVLAMIGGKQTVVGLTSFGPKGACIESGAFTGFSDVFALRDEIIGLKNNCLNK